MASVSLSRSILYNVSSPKLRSCQELSNYPTPKTPSSNLSARSSLKHLKIPFKPYYPNLKTPNIEKSTSDEAFNYLLLRDSGVPRQKALRFASNKNSNSRINNLPSLPLRSKEKFGCGKKRRKFKSYKNENEGVDVDVDKINLALKNAIEKRIEKWNKNVKRSRVCEHKDKEENADQKVRFIMKKVNR